MDDVPLLWLDCLRHMLESIEAARQASAHYAFMKAVQHGLEASVRGLFTEVPNATLLHAYQRTTGKAGDLAADALLAEIERRGLNV